MATTPNSPPVSSIFDSDPLDSRLRGKARQWLTHKVALGFLPAPRTEADYRQRYHQVRGLFAHGDVLHTALSRVPPHARSPEDQALGGRLTRELEEVRLQLEQLRRLSNFEAWLAAEPPSSRVTYNRSPGRLEIRIAPRRNGPLSALLPVSILVAGMICVAAVVGSFGHGPMPWGPLGLLLVGVPFAVLAYLSAEHWLWIQGGTETITLTPAHLKIEADLLRWHGERIFPPETVQHLRFSRPRKGEAGSSVVLRALGRSAPTVAFYSVGQSWRFGGELDERTALTLIAAIEEHLPP